MELRHLTQTKTLLFLTVILLLTFQSNAIPQGIKVKNLPLATYLNDNTIFVGDRNDSTMRFSIEVLKNGLQKKSWNWEQEHAFVKKVTFADDSIKINNLWYVFPSAFKSNSVLYDSLGNGILKFKNLSSMVFDSTKVVMINGDQTVNGEKTFIIPQYFNRGVNLKATADMVTGGLLWYDSASTKMRYSTDGFDYNNLASESFVSTNYEAKLTKGNLTEDITGLQFDNTRQVIGGTMTLSLTSGYVIPTSSQLSGYMTKPTPDANAFLVNDGAGNIGWGGSTQLQTWWDNNEETLLAGVEPALTKGNLTESITGLQFDATRQVIGGSATLSLSSGYFIPTTTEQSTWNAKESALTFNSPLSRTSNTVSFLFSTANSWTNTQTFRDITLSSAYTMTLGTGAFINGASGHLRLPTSAYGFPAGGDIYYDSSKIEYYEGANIRKVASETWVTNKNYISKPTPDANAFLVNDGAGTISWGGSSQLQGWWENVAVDYNSTYGGNNAITGRISFDGEVESTPGGDGNQSVTGKNTLIFYMTDAYTITLTNPTDGQFLWVSNDKDSPASLILTPVRNGANTSLTLTAGNSVTLRYRSNETTWYTTGQ